MKKSLLIQSLTAVALANNFTSKEGSMNQSPASSKASELTDERISELYLSVRRIGHATNRELAFARAVEAEVRRHAAEAPDAEAAPVAADEARKIMFAAYSRVVGDERLTPNQIADTLLSAVRAPAPEAAPVAPDALPPLPESVSDVRAVMRGEVEFLTPCDDYYTAEQMRGYARAALSSQYQNNQGDSDARSAALGEAARVCDEILWELREAGEPNAEHCGACAEAIRELRNSKGEK